MGRWLTGCVPRYGCYFSVRRRDVPETLTADQHMHIILKSVTYLVYFDKAVTLNQFICIDREHNKLFESTISLFERPVNYRDKPYHYQSNGI